MMKPKQHFTLFLPNSVRQVIDLHFTKNRDAYYYVVHSILIKALMNGNKTEKFFPVNNVKIEKIIVRRPGPLLKELCHAGIIQNDGSYIPSRKSLYYRVNPNLISPSEFFIVTPSSSIYNELNGLYTKKNTARDLKKNHLKVMYRHFLNLKFDNKAATQFINTADITSVKRCAYLYSVELFKHKNTRYFKRNKTNTRLDTNLTNLFKPLRKFILESENLLSIDIKNSQPLFFAIIINELSKNKVYSHQGDTLPLCYIFPELDIFKSIDSTVFRDLHKFFKNADFHVFEEFIKFSNLTFSGNFYDYMISVFNNKYSKQEMKNIMFEIFFSENIIQSKNKSFIPYSKSKKLFESVFPNVYKIIYMLKQKNNSDLANLLSKIEAFVIIDLVCEKLVSNNIIPLTIHDSIIVESKDTVKAYEILSESFMSLFNRVPTFSFETIDGQKLSDLELHFNNSGSKPDDSNAEK